VGNIRTAIYDWAFARATGGTFVLRIEDTDATRVKPEYVASAQDTLRWLGLSWDEGPEVGGPYGPYRQSERGERYAAALAQLRGARLAYPCFCSRAEVAAASQAPHGPADEGPRYPGTCRELPAEEVAERSRRRPGRANGARWPRSSWRGR